MLPQTRGDEACRGSPRGWWRRPIRELRELERWVSWGYFWKPDKRKWDKPPIDARTGRLGSSTDPATWSLYEQAADHAARNALPGVGFVLDGQGEHSGVDLDVCRNPETGQLQQWAQVAVDFGETYAEVSPSGRGLRFFVKGRIEGRKIDAAQVELYASGRYLTVTGRHIPGTPTEIREAPRTIAYLQERADQFREAQKTAAELARAAERKKAEKRGTTPGEQATGSSENKRRERPAGERSFWDAVKDRALADLRAWVPNLFPTAQRTSDGGYRVSSHDLGRNLQEDLSLHPEGIKDFGIHDMGDPNDGGRTAIDVVEEYLPTRTSAEAALWLCEQLGLRPEDLGWRGSRQDLGAGAEEQAGASARTTTAQSTGSRSSGPRSRTRPAARSS